MRARGIKQFDANTRYRFLIRKSSRGPPLATTLSGAFPNSTLFFASLFYPFASNPESVLPIFEIAAAHFWRDQKIAKGAPREKTDDGFFFSFSFLRLAGYEILYKKCSYDTNAL